MTIESLTRKHLILKDRLQDIKFRYENLSISVGEAKTRIEIEPEVLGVMEELQRREHERAVGAYEELLTLFMRDVLPGYRDVVMDLRTERSLPALDVYLRKGENMPLEDALSGTGGSVTNILSAGLRFISLARSGRRPFLVLDEPDCWIKPQLAPKFAAVVQSVAEQLGVQVMMISHHDEQMFENLLPHRVRIEKNGNQLSAMWAPTSSQPTWDDEQSGIRSIELIDFQSHTHTIIPLSPGLTLINGDNDIGKSAIVSALRGVFDADSNESYIQHGAKSAKVILDFGPDHVLSWERFRKGKYTVVYEHRQKGISLEDEPMRKSVGAKEVPEWVQDFGIGMIDGIDVQLANQKDPVFILGESPRERAKALAIGGENAHVQEMLAIGKQEITEARLIVRNGEKELEKLHRARQTLEVIEARDGEIFKLEEKSKSLTVMQTENDKISALLCKWKSTKARTLAFSPLDAPLPELPEAPVDQSHLFKLSQRWKKSLRLKSAIEHLSDTDFTVQIPEILPPQSDGLLVRWKKADYILRATEIFSHTDFNIQTPEISTPQLETLFVRWQKASTILKATQLLSGTHLPKLPDAPVDQSHLFKLSQQWHKSLRLKSAAQHLLDADFTVKIPEISTPQSEALLSRWKKASTVLKATLSLSTTSMPELPAISTGEQVNALASRWRKAKSIQHVLSAAFNAPMASVPERDAYAAEKISSTLTRWQNARANQVQEKNQIDHIDKVLHEIDIDMSTLDAKCPECGQALPDHHHNLRP